MLTATDISESQVYVSVAIIFMVYFQNIRDIYKYINIYIYTYIYINITCTYRSHLYISVDIKMYISIVYVDIVNISIDIL